MKELTESTYWVRIYASGPIEIAKQVIRRECLPGGLCVTIEPTQYVFLGGEEGGYVVGLVNYPRFPETPENVLERAKDLALKLLDETYQISILVMAADKTIWISKDKAR